MRQRSAASLAAERVKQRIAVLVEQELDDLLPPIIAAAKAGDVIAFRELLDRGLGKATQSVEMDVEERMLIQDDTPTKAIPSTYQVGAAGILEEDNTN